MYKTLLWWADFEIMKYFGIFTFETQVQNHNAGRDRKLIIEL